MKPFKVVQFVMRDIMRRRVVFAYAAFLCLVSCGMFYFNNDVEKTVVSLMNLLFLIVPLMCIIFGTTYMYNAREFTVLLLAQPVSRRVIFIGQLAGLTLSLCLALIAGTGIPLMLFEAGPAGWLLLALALLLTISFTAIALLVSLHNDDKARGTGWSLLTWFYFAFLFDGLILLVILYFSDYPVEKFVLALSLLNPIDLARILLMMKLHVSAMMGYTGALFVSIFSSPAGAVMAIGCLVGWGLLPAWLAGRKFRNKDF